MPSSSLDQRLAKLRTALLIQSSHGRIAVDVAARTLSMYNTVLQLGLPTALILELLDTETDSMDRIDVEELWSDMYAAIDVLCRHGRL